MKTIIACFALLCIVGCVCMIYISFNCKSSEMNAPTTLNVSTTETTLLAQPTHTAKTNKPLLAQPMHTEKTNKSTNSTDEWNFILEPTTMSKYFDSKKRKSNRFFLIA